MATTKIERAVRAFVRTGFRAYIIRRDGRTQSQVDKHTARLLISNPKSVYQNLIDSFGKPVELGKTSATFKVKKLGTITLARSGENNVLTLRNAK